MGPEGSFEGKVQRGVHREEARPQTMPKKGACGWVITSRFVSQGREAIGEKLVPNPPLGHWLRGSVEWLIFAQACAGTAQNYTAGGHDWTRKTRVFEPQTE